MPAAACAPPRTMPARQWSREPGGLHAQVRSHSLLRKQLTLALRPPVGRDLGRRRLARAAEHQPVAGHRTAHARQTRRARAPTPLGVGEVTAGPTAAAIGNAVSHALGARIRDLPLTRERVMAALLTT